MINPLNLIKRHKAQDYNLELLTELPTPYAIHAATLVKLGDIVTYPFTDDLGNVTPKRVKVVSVDYNHNRVTLERLTDHKWNWIDVPIYDNFPMY